MSNEMQPGIANQNKNPSLNPDSCVQHLGHVGLTPSFQPESRPINVEVLFNSGNLLVRALDTPRIARNEFGKFSLNYDSIDRETADLFGRGDEHGLWYASSTLVLPGKKIPTYKGFGFMFNGATATLHHIHEQDSASNGQGDSFNAAASDLTSLADLATRIPDGGASMNEVNATFRSPDLAGFFAIKAPKQSAKIEAWLLQQRTKESTGNDYPVYIYMISTEEIYRFGHLL